MAALVLLRFIVHDHDNLFVAAEAVHSLGISVLIYKLIKERHVPAIPCAVLALFIHPSTSHHLLNRIFWAFCVYLEAVSVLPQLRVMQNTKIVEPFTAHYVFALGVARFLSCAHWVLQVLDTRGHLLVALGYGLWPSMVLISEIVQTFILADFCYYYVKSVVGGQLVLRLPSGVV
ncbi:ER lumen protein retaining receptor [Sesbania bispinosa]|nr:ER lumen protein retaining receptor [Sesbania bispinosa]